MRREPIEFPFNERKAAQAAAYLVRRHRGKRDYYLLLTLLYAADRRSLLETGVPITGSSLAALPAGPILENVKDCMTLRVEAKEWSRYLDKRNNTILLAEGAPEDTDELCDYEIDLLTEIDETIGQDLKGFGPTRQYRHKHFREWKDPRGSSCSIDPREVLEAEGRSQAEIRRAADNARLAMAVRRHGGSGI